MNAEVVGSPSSGSRCCRNPLIVGDLAAFPTLDPDAPSSIFSHLGRPLGRRSRHFIDRSRQNKLIHDTQLSISLLGDPLTRWGQEEA